MAYMDPMGYYSQASCHFLVAHRCQETLVFPSFPLREVRLGHEQKRHWHLSLRLSRLDALVPWAGLGFTGIYQRMGLGLQLEDVGKCWET
jgi:hypothetical protein